MKVLGAFMRLSEVNGNLLEIERTKSNKKENNFMVI